LPEAQLDRFMLCHRLQYLPKQDEKEVLRRNLLLGVRRDGQGAIARTEFDAIGDAPVGTKDDLIAAMEAVHHVHVSDTFLDHVVEILDRTRKHPAIALGCSPRAGIAMLKASRARALIHGRDYVVPDDLYALAEDCLLHRMRLSYEALADGRTTAGVLEEMLSELGATKTAAATAKA